MLNPPRVYEDFTPGDVFSFTVPALTDADIIDFAGRYDPQRFHLDADAAARTHFGGLVASGFQTQLLCFGPFCREVLVHAAAVGAPGIDELQWLRPWFPGETLDGEVHLLGKKPSSRRADRGYLDFELVAGCDDQPVFRMRWTVIMLTREGANLHSEES